MKCYKIEVYNKEKELVNLIDSNIDYTTALFMECLYNRFVQRYSSIKQVRSTNHYNGQRTTSVYFDNGYKYIYFTSDYTI